MYPSARGFSSSMFSQSNMSHLYRRIDVETGVSGASAHHLTLMLFNGALEAISQAKGAMQTGQIEAKCAAISRAIRIVDEGLRASLNPDAGGDLAGNLANLYSYIATRLTSANLRNDTEQLEECTRLLTPLRDAWSAIRPQEATAVQAHMELRA